MRHRLLCLAVFLAGAPFSTVASTFFVALNGLDSQPGTEAQPWRTIQKAANSLSPGDTVLVRGGVYTERVTINVSGSAAAGFITFANYPGETPILDAAGVVPPSTDTGLFFLNGRSYLVIRGFELRNYKATSGSRVPCGIHVRGAAHHIELRQNHIHGIEYHTASGNAFGIAVYGDAPTPMARIIIDSNHVHDCKTGNSETIAINGNVTDFEVTNNQVHDNTNIGIDCIGYEVTCCGGTSDPVLDRARDGLIRGNTVWNCTSTSNPAYGNTPAAGGIYVDGGTRILIERNTIYQNDIGIELASEHAGKSTDSITVRNNVVWRNKIGGLFMGGFEAARGSAENSTIRHNTFWQNDTLNDGNGEILLQHHVLNNAITHNIFVAGEQNYLLINPPTSNSGNVLDYNAWFALAGAANAEWQWKGSFKTGFPAWRTASGGETHSQFVDPQFVQTGAVPPNLHLGLTSPLVDAGDPGFVVGAGEGDIDGGPRVTGLRVEIGADELIPYDVWRLLHFGANAGNSSISGATADPDTDGLTNLEEFALTADPLVPGTTLTPVVGSVTLGPERYLSISFTRPLSPTGLTYVVEGSPDLSSWTDGSTYSPSGDNPNTSLTSEVSRTAGQNGEVIVIRENLPIGSTLHRFLRLSVTLP